MVPKPGNNMFKMKQDVFHGGLSLFILERGQSA